MIIVASSRAKYVFSFSILILLLLSGCKTIDIGSTRQNQPPLLRQNLDSLIDSNGKIVEWRPVNVKSKWSSEVECYKLKYISDGLNVVGFIVKPIGDGEKYPVIIFNRGGILEYTKITEETLTYLTYLSSNNYVVLASQYRGYDGGQGKNEFGGRDVNDVLNLIKLAKSLPFINPTKIVMLGFSRGGMMTYLAIKHGAEIKAAAVVGGITDLGQTYNEREEAIKMVIRELVGVDKTEWEKRSAYYWPEKIDVPILILHGGDDQRVNVSQAKKLADKLKEAGRVHELVVFPKGDHGLNTNRYETNQKILNWFQKYLNN
jgi:dipeptidyl aminopeptidase/acylaminoacyl peptidase